MRAVGSKHIFGASFMSQTPLKAVVPVVPPKPMPIEEPSNTSMALAIATGAAAIGFAVLSIFRK